MKRVIVIALGILAIWAGYFYWENLRGIGPAIKPPKTGITDGTNNTGLPLKLPSGFSISLFAKDLGAPRVMAYDPVGNLLVSIPSQGRVTALTPDENGDGLADEIIDVARDLNRPHGITFRCVPDCLLYIAESHQVGEYAYDAKTLKASLIRTIAALPDGGNHFTRTIMFRPYPFDSELLISVGSSCNVCEEKDWRRAKILSVDVKESQPELKEFARGLRNSVFMAIHPVTGETWATEMGRDLLGDDIPPDEINIIQEDKNFGWPICYGKNIHDTEFDKKTYIRNPCEEPFEIPSHIDIQAHSAPLGLAFFPEDPPAPEATDGQRGWPEDYWHNLLVAYHGSWNRSVPTGYKIVRYKLDAQGNLISPEPEDFIAGWLTEGSEALGRPVDILIQPGGAIYISDDKAGVIYKVIYRPNNI